MKFEHTPILLDECIEGLNIKPDGVYVDGTVGGGGHSIEIAKRLVNGKLICVDQDEEALQVSRERLRKYSDRVLFIKNNYQNIDRVLDQLGIKNIDGCLLDIGVSSYQIDCEDRGFSYMKNAKLDMRMDRNNSFSAYDVVNTYSSAELTKIISGYGEEKWAKRIAEFIVQSRKTKAIDTTFDLVHIIEQAIPKKVRIEMAGHSSKKTFQAIRIEVNKELDVLGQVIPKVVERLNPKGRFEIITFHSLEDRIVKKAFKDLTINCICPPEVVVCVCNHHQVVKLITKKPIEPIEDEKKENSRARSAKLRICEKL